MFGRFGLPELIILLFVCGVIFAIFKLPRVLSAIANATASGSPDSTRQTGKILLGVGAFLLIFSAIRWNSAESQLSRAFGGSDGLAILLFLSGAIAAWIGYKISSGAVPPSRSTAKAGGKSVEERIRELDTLRSKQLITDAEYDERKKQIIASL